jgi:Flp pilus assembly protein TadG
MRPCLRPLGGFATARQGIAAVEFALVGMLLAVLLIGLYDLTNAYILWRRLTQAAQSISEITTKVAVQPDGTNKLTYSQAATAASAIYPLVPSTQTMPKSAYGVAMTVVTFKATPPGCTTNCSYTGSPVWSATLEGSQPGRSCGILTPVADGQAPSTTTLPADAFQATSILVVDVSATYVPTFLAFITGPLKLTRSAYLPPRSGTITDFILMTDAASYPVTICP